MLKKKGLSMTPGSIIVIPAYGRDYMTAEAASKDWEAGKDFMISDVSSPYNGKYCSNQDLGPGVQVKIRYNKKTCFTFVQNGMDEQNP